MTNFNVIEAYTEDFTKWAYRNSRGTAKITNNTIVIANVVETNNIVEDDNEPYSDLTISVTGVTENKYLIVRQGRGKPETHIKKDGVYTFKDNNLYFGFGVSVIGECNITIAQLPTSILKDFSGNGNHAYLYGGKGKLNSGMGVYQQDFSNVRGVTTVSANTNNQTHIQEHNLWDEIDKEVNSLNADQKAMLAEDDVYNSLSAELQFMVQEELVNSVRDKIANSPRGKELLEKQLNNIRAKKDIIVEKTNKELELFKKFQIAAQANPKLTYVEFCKTINNE